MGKWKKINLITDNLETIDKYGTSGVKIVLCVFGLMNIFIALVILLFCFC